ncbi:hypothetical protein [Variovorax sp. dw_308]|uniref:hypothetical protein n=1 Tax=Variovorax sp. dw_308 TaxID=2721546 RepID=UPI001C478830|nr:hypothetical protein [Variovorax sp. dw_308]
MEYAKGNTENVDFDIVAALRLPQDDIELARRLRLEPRPFICNAEWSTTLAGEMLFKHLGSIYRPFAQSLTIIRSMVDHAIAYASTVYPTRDAFIRSVQGQLPTVTDVAVRLVTSPPGCGKSADREAVRRLFANATPLRPSSFLPDFPFHPFALLKVTAHMKLCDVLNGVVESVGQKADYKKAGPVDVKHARTLLHQRGVCGVLADEMQFHTRSSQASARTSGLLDMVCRLGHPLHFFANYSLGHRLKTRPPEETTRFLFHPHVLLPDLPNDPALIGLLEDIQIVLGEVCTFKLRDSAGVICAMTFGIKRLILRLVRVTYEIAHRQCSLRSLPVRMTEQHLRDAYWSLEFQEDRAIADNTRNAMLGLRAVKDDFRCPFELDQSADVRQRALADATRQIAIDEAALSAARSAAQRDSDRKNKEPPDTPQQRPPGRPVRPPPRTPDDLRGSLF